MSDAVTKPVESPAVQPAKNNSSSKVIIACCAVLLLVLCLCCGSLILIFGATASSTLAVLNQVQTSVLKVCDGKEADLRGFYDNTTSQNFKKNTTYTEFKTFFQQYKDIILDCSELKAGTFLNSKINGMQINAETKNGVDALTVQYESKGNTVLIEFVSEVGNWKVNSIQIK